LNFIKKKQNGESQLEKNSVLFDKLKSIVGAENVAAKDIIMEAYTASYNLKERDSPGLYGTKFIEKPKKPSFIVRAGSTKEIQELVRLANEYKIPLVPMGALTSQYSESVPSEGGIMLDFSRMKEIEIDEELMTVTFEPGVTFAQAYRDLAVKGYHIGHQSTPSSISVLGTTSQAGMHLPWDKYAINFWGSTYFTELTIGTEVVLPTGELLVTGSAALPGAKPQRPRAYGPNVAALFLAAQGTLGIIVKQTLPLWRIPEYRHVIEGDFKNDNFKGLVRAYQRLIEDNIEGPVWAEKVWANYYNETWEFFVHLYGRKGRVEFNREFAEQVIREEGGTIKPGLARVLDPENDYSGGLVQFYEEMIYWRNRANSIAMPPPNMSWVNIAAFGPFAKMAEAHAAMQKVLAKHGVPISRIRGGFMFPGGPTGLMFTLNYMYDLNDAEEVKRAKAINEEWPRVIFQEVLHMPPPKGFSGLARNIPAGYRLGPAAAKTAMPMLGEYYLFLKKLKRTMDPNRIMNPGHLMDIEP
jgi:FAD/FMN-containing dehydrogenase